MTHLQRERASLPLAAGLLAPPEAQQGWGSQSAMHRGERGLGWQPGDLGSRPGSVPVQLLGFAKQLHPPASASPPLKGWGCLRSSLFEVAQGPAAAGPGSLLKVQSLRPPQLPLNLNLHRTQLEKRGSMIFKMTFGTRVL